MINLTISKEGERFLVDCKDWTGSPSVGRGRTMAEAMGVWLRNNQNKVGIAFQVDPSAWPAEKRRRRREMRRR